MMVRTKNKAASGRGKQKHNKTTTSDRHHGATKLHNSSQACRGTCSNGLGVCKIQTPKHRPMRKAVVLRSAGWLQISHDDLGRKRQTQAVEGNRRNAQAMLLCFLIV